MSLGKAPKLEYPEPYFQQHDSCVSYGDQMSNSPQGSSGSIGHIDNNLNSDFGSETINPGDLADEVAKKRANRLHKNRVAARECRRKKKEYIKCLENRVQILEAQNKSLIEELSKLKEQYQSQHTHSGVTQPPAHPANLSGQFQQFTFAHRLANFRPAVSSQYNQFWMFFGRNSKHLICSSLNMQLGTQPVKSSGLLWDNLKHILIYIYLYKYLFTYCIHWPLLYTNYSTETVSLR